VPADAADDSGEAIRLGTLLRHLAEAPAYEGQPALRQWLDAAEAKNGAIPDAGVGEILEDWAVRLEYLEQEERFAAMDELIADMEREHGPVNEERVQEIIRRWQAEYPHIDFPQLDQPPSGSSSTATV
jgi:hypothetical protein